MANRIELYIKYLQNNTVWNSGDYLSFIDPNRPDENGNLKVDFYNFLNLINS